MDTEALGRRRSFDSNRSWPGLNKWEQVVTHSPAPPPPSRHEEPHSAQLNSSPAQTCFFPPPLLPGAKCFGLTLISQFFYSIKSARRRAEEAASMGRRVEPDGLMGLETTAEEPLE